MNEVDRHRGPLLSCTPLFAGLDEAAIEDVLGRARSRPYAPGQLICHQGDPSESLFVLRSGSAQAVVTSVTESRETTVARLRPGDVIGEVGVVTDRPRSASVIARSNVFTLELMREDFVGLLIRHPRLLTNLTQLLGGRLAKRNADLRGRPAGEIVAVVVGTGLARAAVQAVSAARCASPEPLAVVDLLGQRADRNEDGTGLRDACTPGSITEALERLDTLAASHGPVAIVVGADEAGIDRLFEHVDRVLGLLTGEEARALTVRLHATSQQADLVLLANDLAAGPPPSDAYRVVRRCAEDLSAQDVAWLGRHLSRTKLGLALGAGGAKAFAHAGVIQALERAGYCVDYVAGSSMGAVVAVWLALGMTGAEIAATLTEQCGGAAVVNAVFRKGAAGDGVEVFTRIFRETTADRAFADLSIPVTVMTADVARRCPAPLTTGPLWEALMAALAIPGLYPPWTRGGQRLVDAVSLTPVPLDAVLEAGADITIAVNLLGRETLSQWPGDDGSALPPLPVPGHARDTVVEVLELAQLDASARQTARADVPITPRFGPGTWRHMELGRFFFEAGSQAAESELPRLHRLARPVRVLV
jgi:NTE family protein